MTTPSSPRRDFLKTALHFAALGAVIAPTARAAGSPTSATKPDFFVRDFGAKGDGHTFDTVALQAAIDACNEAGGGRVVLHGGTFLTRTLRLKSHVTLYIEAGAVLLGSPQLDDYEEIHPAYRTYTYSHRALIYAEKADNVSILGRGAIDLQGRAFPAQEKHQGGGMEWGQSPFGLRLVQCRDLTLRDITIRNCPMAALRIVAGQNVLVDGLIIDNRVRISCDGLEIVSSREVCVSNCRITSWDDAICIKSASPDLCRNITVTNCVISSLCNAIKLGTESTGGFENITIANCTIEGGVETSGERAGWRSINGLALMIVDGGIMNQIAVSNLVMRGVRTALFIHIGNRGRLYSPDQPKPGIGVLRNVTISHVIAEVVDADYCCSISGQPGFPVENIVLDDVHIRTPGGGAPALAARVVPEKPAAYPESIMWGPLPAYGFFCRHARGVTLRNLRLETAAPDARPALVGDDLSDLEVIGLRASAPSSGPLVRLNEIRGACMQQSAALGETEIFLHVTGSQSSAVALFANDLRRVRTSFTQGEEAASAVRESGNLTRF